MNTVSYAQNYEDVMLLRALRSVQRGFYIDVGAQDPIDDSVTKAFYELGWSGINVEPVTHWYQRILADRPHDINLQLAVSDQPGQLHLYEVEGSGLSTTDTEFAARHTQAGHRIHESDIQCVTLDWICSQHNVTVVHFLKIDCEGAEAAALRGLSLQQVRPWIILLESTEPNSQIPNYAEWEPLLTGRGYCFAYADGLNRFYVADEHAELLTSFKYPPNVFDRFVRADEAAAHKRIQQAQGQLDAFAGAHRIGQLEERAAYLNAENERREAALEELRRHLAEANELLRRSAEEMAHLREENVLRETTLVELRSRLKAREASLSTAEDTVLQEADELNKLRRQLESMGRALTDSTGERISLDKEVAQLCFEMNAIYQSKSWRLTAPLRFIRHALSEAYLQSRHVAYVTFRCLIRTLRPLFRGLAEWTWLRSLIVHVVGRDSKLVSRARLFLFGPPPLSAAPIASEASLTRQAIQVLSVIDKVRKSKQLDNTPGGE